MNYAAMGAKIQELRKKQGLSQAELADMVYCSASKMSKFECGKQFDLDLLEDVCKVLDADLLEVIQVGMTLCQQ